MHETPISKEDFVRAVIQDAAFLTAVGDVPGAVKIAEAAVNAVLLYAGLCAIAEDILRENEELLKEPVGNA